MNEFYIAGNWKMNKSPAQALDFVNQLKRESSPGRQHQIVLLPPALVSWQVDSGLKGSAIRWGAQNCYFEVKGAFTGENSAQVLREMGADFCLVGHSERRQIFGESDELLSKKLHTVQEQGLTPILCVGETSEERRSDRTEEVIVHQLRMGLKMADEKKPLWLAYEPVWAIGTGQVATSEQVEQAHAILRKALREWSAASGDSVPILYGGSVKPDNVRSLATLANVNGFLIGGASLDPEEFLTIQKTAVEVRTR